MPKRCVTAWRSWRAASSWRTAGFRIFRRSTSRGWELIVSGLTPESLERHRARVQRVTLLGEHRYSLELPLEPAPELLLRDLLGGGAQLVSLNPIRETLEDFFVKKVAEQASARFDARAAS